MSEQQSAKNQPCEVSLEAGKTYYWCRCGRSQNQPFCDGSHKGTDIEPVAFSVDDSKDYWLCNCKKTGDRPFCDGTHNNL